MPYSKGRRGKSGRKNYGAPRPRKIKKAAKIYYVGGYQV